MDNQKLRQIIREEIKKVLNKNLTQQDLITLFKKKSKNQVMIIFLKHSGQYRNIEVAIDDLNQLTYSKTYGTGTTQSGDAIEFKFSEVSSVKII